MIQFPARLSRYLQLATIFALLASPVAGLAQDLPEGHPPVAHERASDAQGPNGKSDSVNAEAKSASPLLPPTSITHHTIKVASVPLDYTAEAGTVSLPGADGKSLADIFYVATRASRGMLSAPSRSCSTADLAQPRPICISAASARVRSR